MSPARGKEHAQCSRRWETRRPSSSPCWRRAPGRHLQPVNYRLAPQELAFILQDGAARALVFETEGGETVARAQALLKAEGGASVAHWSWGQIVAAHVVAKPGAAPTAEALDAFLVHGDRLAAYKRPRRYHFRESLPKTASGKIQKQLLRVAA